MRSSDELITGRRAVAEAIGTGRAIEVLVAPGARRNQGLRAVLGAADRARVPVREVGRADLDQLARDHRGVIARIRPTGSYAGSLSERDLAETAWADDAIAVVLDGIEDPQNLAAAARSPRRSPDARPRGLAERRRFARRRALRLRASARARGGPVNEGPSEPTEPPASGRASRPSGSRFEDLTNFEVPVDAVVTGRR